MNVLSLFSGVGGFDLGLENAGMKTIYQCEWDKHANTILERHWPQVPRWGDISTLTAKEILRHGTPPDVVAWGSPCQDLSVAGKRAGLEGERSGLFHEGIRIINELRKETNNEYPKISIWENVAGALSSNRGADFGVILDEMAKAGAMVIEWGLLDAQHFGIPQRRRRVFVIAIFNFATATNCPNPLLPIRESLPRDSKKGKSKRESATSETSESLGAGSEWWDGGQVADALTTTSNEQRMPDKKRLQVVVQETPTRLLGSDIIGSLNATDYKWPQNQQLDENKFIVTEPMLLDIQRVGDIRVYTPPVQALQARMGTGGNSTPMLVYPIDTRNALRDPEKYDAQNRQGLGIGEDGDPMATLTSAHVNGVAVQYDGYNQRVNETDVALTIRIGRDSSDFIAQPTEPTMAVRRLTPLECERLMGWPDDHTRYKADGTEQADTHRYKQCGNGVASPVAEWIGKQLMKLDEAPQ
jgi:DNA (cytosine-5)-methyltransferase 1